MPASGNKEDGNAAFLCQWLYESFLSQGIEESM